jgi:hypothetical protein
MNYKGFDIQIHFSASGATFDIPAMKYFGIKLDPHMTMSQAFQFINDKIDLHLGRGVDPSNFDYVKFPKGEGIGTVNEKQVFTRIVINREEVAREIGNVCSPPIIFDSCEKHVQSIVLRYADAAISCIKQQDPSIISDDINHGKRHEFDRDTIARMTIEYPDQNINVISWDRMLASTKDVCREKADRIISYVEEIIYG